MTKTPTEKAITMTEYSGRTTTHSHLISQKGEWKNTLGAGEECIQKRTVFEAQWTNCPVEVEKEVRKLWNDFEFGNDNYYAEWNEECAETYPLIAEFLKSKGVTGDCLIHWWW